MDLGKPLYLSSLESVRFESVRECRFVEFLTFDTGKLAAHVTVQPGVQGQDFDLTEDITALILATRFEGDSIDHIEKFPLFVFITIPSKAKRMPSSPLRTDDLQIIGWGELYRSRDDAARHKFD